MPWFMCEYSAWPRDPIKGKCEIGNYSSFIWAKDRAHADALAAKRRLGEKVLCRWGRRGRKSPYELPSAQLKWSDITSGWRLDIGRRGRDD